MKHALRIIVIAQGACALVFILGIQFQFWSLDGIYDANWAAMMGYGACAGAHWGSAALNKTGWWSR